MLRISDLWYLIFFKKLTMTLLLSWVGKDSRKISSVYIASDSRFSWGTTDKYDFGRKVFAMQNSPDIVGYCGDVLYPSLVISQIMDMDREGILFPQHATFVERSEILYKEISKQIAVYPTKVAMNNSLEIIHISRHKEVDFKCFVYKWTNKKGWENSEMPLPDRSDKILVLGSGKDEFYGRYLQYLNGNNGKTSRSLFQCLCHTLLKTKDLQCGGAPQLVGLYNRFNGKNFGIVYNGNRFFLGKELEQGELVNNIEWRNELFERYDGSSLKLINGAQRQPDELAP